MADVLLATCADLPAGDEDAPVLDAALARAGVTARWAVWTDPDVDWSALTVLRTTWDYTHRVEDFVRWADRPQRLLNPPDVVRWSSDKTYLADLRAAGVPVVPTTVLAPGTPLDAPQDTEFVVKPAVGAGSRGAGRFAPDEPGRAAAQEHLSALHDAGRTALVQPYLAQVDGHGETALIFVEGRFSHAIRKAALLREGALHPVDGESLWVPESITSRVPTPDEHRVADLALAAVRERFGADQLYTRVDLLPSPDGPVVIELELVEPSLFLGHAPQDEVDRFARAIAERA